MGGSKPGEGGMEGSWSSASRASSRIDDQSSGTNAAHDGASSVVRGVRSMAFLVLFGRRNRTVGRLSSILGLCVTHFPGTDKHGAPRRN